MVFQQSRVKDYNFDEWKAERSARNKTKSKNGEKARAFLLQLEKCTKKLKQFRTEKASEILRREEISDGRRKKTFKQQKVERPIAKSSSEQEHKVNALASGADEGRDKLR